MISTGSSPTLQWAAGAWLLVGAVSCQTIFGIEQLSASPSGQGGHAGAGGVGAGGAGGACEVCYSGAPATEDVGACKSGCDDGEQCKGEVLPACEVCATPEIDENCDGEPACVGDSLFMLGADTTIEEPYAYLALDREGNLWATGNAAEDMKIRDLALDGKGTSAGYLLKISPAGKPLLLQSFRVKGGYGDATGIQVLSGGDIVVSGFFSGTLTIGDDVHASDGESGYVARFDGATGKPVWTRAFTAQAVSGGAAFDLAVAPDDSISVCGAFYGTFSGEDGLDLVSTNGNYDVFVARLDAEGGLLGAERFGGDGNDYCFWIDSGPSGELAILGRYEDSFEMGTKLDPALGADVFAAYLSPELDPKWAQGFRGNGDEDSSGIAIDRSSGRVLVGGTFTFKIDAGKGSATSNGSDDAFLASFEPDGKLAWFKTFGGVAAENLNSVALDAAGQILLGGSFAGAFDLDACHINSSGGQNFERADAFVAKLNSDGTCVWAKKAGTPTYAEAVVSVTSDPLGNVYAAGRHTTSIGFPGGDTATCVSPCFRGMFFTKFSP